MLLPPETSRSRPKAVDSSSAIAPRESEQPRSTDPAAELERLRNLRAEVDKLTGRSPGDASAPASSSRIVIKETQLAAALPRYARTVAPVMTSVWQTSHAYTLSVRALQGRTISTEEFAARMHGSERAISRNLAQLRAISVAEPQLQASHADLVASVAAGLEAFRLSTQYGRDPSVATATQAARKFTDSRKLQERWMGQLSTLSTSSGGSINPLRDAYADLLRSMRSSGALAALQADLASAGRAA